MSLPTTSAPPQETLTRRAAAVELLKHHAVVAKRQRRTRDALIEAARDAGLSWPAIGAALESNAESLRVQWVNRDEG